MGRATLQDKKGVFRGIGNNSEKLQSVWRKTERGRQSIVVRSVREWNVLREELVSVREVGVQLRSERPFCQSLITPTLSASSASVSTDAVETCRGWITRCLQTVWLKVQVRGGFSSVRTVRSVTMSERFKVTKPEEPGLFPNYGATTGLENDDDLGQMTDLDEKHQGNSLEETLGMDLPFPQPWHSSAAPRPSRFTVIGSQDLDVKSRPNLSTQFHVLLPLDLAVFENSPKYYNPWRMGNTHVTRFETVAAIKRR
ncbi:hypothetical protein PR048_009745 [Dryococelus australis]|uniref:Uncharacterized protein n=1 Tax=Dryococelus australis TaxID=614101 RepID=A0ABQ9I0R8_9NEOP|nr:hypothetical protein PR048_009745 [Dryococelus australis]